MSRSSATTASRRIRGVLPGLHRLRVGWWCWRARLYRGRHQYALARRVGQRALSFLGSDPDPRLTRSRVRALLLLSGIHEDLADHETSKLQLHRALSLLPDGPEDPRDGAAVVDTLTRLGNVARLQGRYEQAEQYLQRAVAIAASFPDRADRAVRAIGARNALAITFKDTGRYDEAAALYRDVLPEVRVRFGVTSSAVATAYHNLAGLAYARGDFQAAEPLARHAVRLRTRRVGAHHQDLAADLAVLAAVLLGGHRLDEAERAYLQALSIYTRVFGFEHYEVAVVLNGLATIEGERGRPVRAEPLYRRALAIKEGVLGPEHAEIGVLLNNLAVVHRQAGKLDAAAACYRRALPLLIRSLGDQHPTVVVCSDNLAALIEPTARSAPQPDEQGEPAENRSCRPTCPTRHQASSSLARWTLDYSDFLGICQVKRDTSVQFIWVDPRAG